MRVDGDLTNRVPIPAERSDTLRLPADAAGTALEHIRGRPTDAQRVADAMERLQPPTVDPRIAEERLRLRDELRPDLQDRITELQISGAEAGEITELQISGAEAGEITEIGSWSPPGRSDPLVTALEDDGLRTGRLADADMTAEMVQLAEQLRQDPVRASQAQANVNPQAALGLL